jgi:hypothetical protein
MYTKIVLLRIVVHGILFWGPVQLQFQDTPTAVSKVPTLLDTLTRT